MSKEGYGTIIGVLLFTSAITIGAVVSSALYLKIFAVMAFIVTAIVIYFFRDPEREVPDNPNAVYSPADGKVIDIKEEYEAEFLKEKATRVSIFLSVFDVHVNWIPISGTIEHLRYQKGKFVQAFKSDASLVNEQTFIGIQSPKCNILFKQIAGILARRIVCHVRVGNQVKAGEKFGFMKFGSRIDIFLPKNVEVKVQLKQKVKGGESLLGVITNDS